MAYQLRGTATAGFGLYSGSVADESDKITQVGAYFGLQGDDVLSTAWNVKGSMLVGGSGNDTYIIDGNTNVMDMGGGNDTLSFKYLTEAQIPLVNWRLINIENDHLVIADDYHAVVIFNYETSHSSIERVEFNDGETISFQSFLNQLIHDSGQPTYSSLSALAIAPTTAADINNMLDELYALNKQYEAEVTASGLQRVASVGDAQMIGRLYQAAFNRLPDEGGLNNWIEMWERGWSTEKIAGAFIESEEFGIRYGSNTSDADYVQALYVNALGREPDQGGYDAWLNNLQSGSVSREDMLLGFSDSAENIARTEPTFSDMAEINGQWLFS